MLNDRTVAIAADYADALLVFRRAKRTLLLFLVVMLLMQLGIFAAKHFTQLLDAKAIAASTQPAVANWPHLLHYVTVVTTFLSMIFAALLVVTLFATIHVMLVGRLVGVSLVARAFTLSVFVFLLLVPWQALLVTTELTKADPVIPGVLYTWREISERVPPTEALKTPDMVLYWARFAVFPLVALIMLLVVQVRSGRGLKLALGEEELLPLESGDVAVIHTR